MQYLLLVRVATVAFIFWVLQRYDEALTAPLSNSATIIHEWGHAVGANLLGGTVEGYTLSTDVSTLFACTRGGSEWLTLILGNVFSLFFASVFVWLGTQNERNFRLLLGIFAALMWFLAKAFGDERILDMDMVQIYLLIFAVIFWLKPNWTGAILIFLGFLNLWQVAGNLLKPDALSDVVRFSKLLPIVPPIVWSGVWGILTAYVGFQLFNLVSYTRVEWKTGQYFWKNWDFDKTFLFLTLLPEMLWFAIDQAFDWVIINVPKLFNEALKIFDFRKK